MSLSDFCLQVVHQIIVMSSLSPLQTMFVLKCKSEPVMCYLSSFSTILSHSNSSLDEYFYFQFFNSTFNGIRVLAILPKSGNYSSRSDGQYYYHQQLSGSSLKLQFAIWQSFPSVFTPSPCRNTQDLARMVFFGPYRIDRQVDSKLIFFFYHLQSLGCKQ